MTSTINPFASLGIGVTKAFATMQTAMRSLAAAVSKAGTAFTRLRVDLDEMERRTHGLGNQAGDGTWQSDLCAAWVHGSCPSGRLCVCRCHGAPRA